MSKVIMRCLSQENVKGTIEWVTGATTPNNTIAEIVNNAKTNDIKVVFLPLTIEFDNKTQKAFGYNPEFAKKLLDHKVQSMSEVYYDKTYNKEEVNMNNKNTLEQWDANIENLANELATNTCYDINEQMASASEEEIIEAMDAAINDTIRYNTNIGNTEAVKKTNAVKAKFQSLKYTAQKKGLLSLLKRSLKRAWAKIWAVIKGTGMFGFHTVKIIGKHSWNIAKNIGNETIQAGKEIGQAFKADIIDPVKNA